MAQHSWRRLGWNPLGLTGTIAFWAASILALLYTLPIPLSLLLNWPPRGTPPFSLPRVLAWTVGQAALSAAIAVAVGWPLGVVAGFYRSRAARLAVALSFAPFMSPVVVVALGLRSLYGRGGLLYSLAPQLSLLARGWTGVVALHSYFNIGLAAAVTAAAASTVERSVVEHALAMGLRGLKLWRHLLIPATARAALYAWSLAFLYSYASAGPLMVEGAAYRYYTLEAWLYTLHAAFPSLSGLTAGLALLELGLAAAAASAVVAFQGGLAALPIAVRGEGVIELKEWPRITALLYSLAVIAYLYSPLAALAFEASRASLNLLLQASSIGPGLTGALLNSAAYASVTVALSLLLGVAIAPSRAMAVATLSLIAVAPVAYGVTATLAYYHNLSKLAGPVLASALLIVMAHTASALPLASRILATAWERTPRELLEHMLTLGLRGASLIRHWLHTARSAAAIAAALAAAASLGEFGATLVVSVPKTWSLTVLVYHFYSSGRMLPEASLAALILEAITAATLAVVYLAASRRG
jgi:thiamine transport system permease protein